MLLAQNTFATETYLLPSLSMWRATSSCPHFALALLHFYPRSPYGERPHTGNNISAPPHFYPRSPCGERPAREKLAKAQEQFLSTLSLRRATDGTKLLSMLDIFLSTLSLRRATSDNYNIVGVIIYFYPRSPCGERPTLLAP